MSGFAVPLSLPRPSATQTTQASTHSIVVSPGRLFESAAMRALVCQPMASLGCELRVAGTSVVKNQQIDLKLVKQSTDKSGLEATIEINRSPATLSLQQLSRA